MSETASEFRIQNKVSTGVDSSQETNEFLVNLAKNVQELVNEKKVRDMTKLENRAKVKQINRILNARAKEDKEIEKSKKMVVGIDGENVAEEKNCRSKSQLGSLMRRSMYLFLRKVKIRR